MKAAIGTKTTDHVQEMGNKQDGSTKNVDLGSKKSKYAATVEDADDAED